MNASKLAGLALALMVAAGAGYWFGQGGAKVGAGPTQADAPPVGGSEQGLRARGAVNVGAGETAMNVAAAPAATGAKKILYYRNPMGLPDTSPTPKKDSMGMDYLPVHEGEDEDDGKAVKLSPAKVQKLGVRTEPAARRELDRAVRAVGRIEADERRLYAVAPKFEGWIEKLHVNVTGQPVARGQALFDVYSPELVSAQREYQVAARGVATLAGASPEAQESIRQVAAAALARLANWDIPAEDIARLEAGSPPRRTLTLRSPFAGIVTEKKALQGARFMPGEALYQIADLSSVWVMADVFERDIAGVRPGQAVEVSVDAYPDRRFPGKVGYVYPTVNAQTRTVPVRVELANPGGLLRPAMYANVALNVGAGGTALTVPAAAVIDSGTAQRIIVQVGEGRFEPRDVKLGRRGDAYVEVKEGVGEGEPVVVAANFLIDSESNLKAALSGMGGRQEAQKTPAATVSHHAVGTLDAVDAAGALTITHEPVASLKWPGMTMEFVAANAALVAGIKPGSPVAFEFVERTPGEWVVTKLEKR